MARGRVSKCLRGLDFFWFLPQGYEMGKQCQLIKNPNSFFNPNTMHTSQYTGQGEGGGGESSYWYWSNVGATLREIKANSVSHLSWCFGLIKLAKDLPTHQYCNSRCKHQGDRSSRSRWNSSQLDEKSRSCSLDNPLMTLHLGINPVDHFFAAILSLLPVIWQTWTPGGQSCRVALPDPVATKHLMDQARLKNRSEITWLK